MTWKGPVFVDTLQTALQGRSGLANVLILSHPPNETPQETIVLGDITGRQEWHNMGPKRRQDEFSVRCAVGIQRAGVDDVAAKLSRDRATVLLAEVESQLASDVTVGGVAISSNLDNIVMRQGTDGTSVFTIITFDIKATCRV